MSFLDTKKEIKEILLRDSRRVRPVDKARVAMRCFLCGDSKKNTEKKRLYIKIDLENPTEPILYKCFNCNAEGIMTKDMLVDMGINDMNLHVGIARLNKNATIDDGSIRGRYKNNETIKVTLPPLYKKDSTKRKLKYLFERLGDRLSLEEVEKMKLIFSIHDFLRVNNIEPHDRPIPTWVLERDYIGFLSRRNDYIIFRDITGENKMRYVKYNIFLSQDNSDSFYAISNKIDIMTQDEIEIIVAEGTFDTLSIYANILNHDDKNKILLSSCNGSLMAPIMFYLRKGYVGSNITVSIYQDNDTKVNFKKMKEKLSPYIGKFRVYYNTLNKDFGVPKDKIEIDEIII